MFEQLVIAITEYPYFGVALVFLICGLGFPLPEEIVLLAAGYVCAKFPDHASLPLMMAWCAGAIAVGDLVPFLLGRLFGVRLLRVRWLRYVVTKRRLASFDHWFRQRGDLVIVISRFLAGLRVVAFFTAGAMKMPWLRFLLLDGIGIALIVPLLTWLGYHSAGVIEEVIVGVQQIERGILWATLAAGAALLVWFWVWRRRQLARRPRPTEAFVQPQRPVESSQAAANGNAAPPDSPAAGKPPLRAAPGGGGPPAGSS